MSLYIGFDSSTQSLTAVVIEVTGHNRRIVLEQTLSFDETLPQYRTRHGVLTSEEGRTVVAPAAMWADALDRMMATLAASRLDLRSIRAISGAGQQHGSVYVSAQWKSGLARIDPERAFAPQIAGML